MMGLRTPSASPRLCEILHKPGLGWISASPHPVSSSTNLAHGRIAAKLNPGLTAAKRTRRTPTCRAGEDAPPLPKNQFPAEGPLFQPSLALNIDPAPDPSTHPHHSVTPSASHPAPVSPPLSPIQANQHNSLPSSSPRALYQIQPRAHPRLSELQARIPLSVSLPVFQSQTPAVR